VEIDIGSFLYALFKSVDKDLFLKMTEEYKNSEISKNELKNLLKNIPEMVPKKYKILIETISTMPMDSVIDLIANFVKELFRTNEGKYKTCGEVIREALNAYL